MVRVALVTGGSRGIGSAIVRDLAGSGLRVHFTWHRQEEAARHLAAALAPDSAAGRPPNPGEAPGRAIPHRLDIRDAGACEALVDAIVREEGRLDVLVNNAGALRDGLFAMQREDDWREMIETNLNGPRHCARAAIRTMIEARRGTIINLASVAGVLGAPGQTNYAAAKGAIIAFTKALAREVGGHGVLVHAVAPGLIDTDMLADLPPDLKERALSRVPLRRIGRPEEVAAIVGFLASERCSYTTGHVFFVDGGLAM